MKLFTPVFIFFVLFLTSCGEVNQEPEIEIKQIAAHIGDEDNFDYDTLRGMYEGDFGKSPIRIILNYVSSSNAIGYNIHKGLQRNLNGKVTRSGDTVTVVLHEPGDHEFDGVFTLTFIGIDKKPTGNWVHNEGWVPSKELKLKKQEIKEAKDDEINASNFADYFNLVFDSLGTYYFLEEGLVRYEYYPYKDDNSRVEQLKEVRGSWYLTDNKLKIDWQKNNRFAKPTEEYTLTESEWGGHMLKGESIELHPMYW